MSYPKRRILRTGVWTLVFVAMAAAPAIMVRAVAMAAPAVARVAAVMSLVARAAAGAVTAASLGGGRYRQDREEK